jgi:acetylornithine/N-succinyldiaminopimelate aminotransferase
MKTAEVETLYSQFLLPSVKRISVCLVRGKGSRVWDLEGKEYLDFFPGWGVSGLGHCHPAVGYALKHQARKMVHISNNYLNLKQVELAREISKWAFPGKCFFSNSGAEAVEAAIKFARKYGQESGRFEIITMKRSFHGRTYGAMTATGQDRIHEGFSPLVPGFAYADFNDLESVKRLVTDKTVAILLEPVQGEGGINVATPEFLRGLRVLCDAKDLLLILDEVQTGMGRTGKLFAYQHYGIEPDLMVLAKSLGNGVPIGALVVNSKVKREIFTPGTHASTYGGNPLVCAAALAVLKTIQKERLLGNVERLGSLLKERLLEMKSRFPVIREVRGLGLMIGVELNVPGAPYVDRAREKGLLINCTQENVLRLLPAINLSKKGLEGGLFTLEKVFEELK